MATQSANWEMRLHFQSGPEFVTARKVVEKAGIEYETESISGIVPEGATHIDADKLVSRGTIFIKIADYLKVQPRLQSIYHRIEMLQPDKKA